MPTVREEGRSPKESEAETCEFVAPSFDVSPNLSFECQCNFITAFLLAIITSSPYLIITYSTTLHQ